MVASRRALCLTSEPEPNLSSLFLLCLALSKDSVTFASSKVQSGLDVSPASVEVIDQMSRPNLMASLEFAW